MKARRDPVRGEAQRRPGRGGGWRRRLARIALAGVIAGTAAAMVETALWWMFTDALPEVLWRDVRFAAAIVLGPGDLDGGGIPSGKVIAAATVVHFALSIAASVPLAWIVPSTRSGAIVVGAAFGVALFALDLYGFTAIFPWFAADRDPITLAAHVVLGAWAALLLRRNGQARAATGE